MDELAGAGLVAAGLLYLFFDLFGGPLRAGLGMVGLTALIYVPAAAALVALLANALVRIGDSRTSVPVLAVVGFLVVETMIAMALGRRLEAALFQLYILMPGLVMMSLVQRGMQDRLIRALVPVFFFALTGVLLNMMIRFPWADSTYEVMGRQVAAAREWQAGGQPRLAGFTRASFLAAGQILIGFCALEHRLKSLPWRAFWYVLGLIGVHYTTSKSPELAMVLLPAAYLIIGRARASDAARRKLLANLLMGFWVALIFAGPFISMTYAHQLYPGGTGVGRGYSSLADRLLNTWPNAMSMIDWRNSVTLLVGRGLGGIGTPSMMFDTVGNPADNLAVYLFVALGLVSLGAAVLIFRGGQRAIAAGGRGRRDFTMIVAMLGVGSAANVIEAVVPLMAFGLAIAYQRPRTRTSGANEDGSGQRRRRRRRSSASPVGEAAVHPA
ncbi:hypothetical protein K7957_14520 [Sphingomonas yunnanensis]|uniref:hypothetical protein n=1 Tax=Sphingomonas yunnanensis TaxID=310400 RepID=UPI001CA65807|nr:hypothetical protein [Sphingomonas yunnanensis]MBY9064153.1 hypothetical protein [Sphingomonas yunnanensis]